MAQKPQVTEAERKAELISELAWARAELARDFQDARNDLDLVARLRHSVEHRKTAWITGAAVAGWILSRLPGRKKKQSTPKALPVGDSTGSSGRAAFWLAVLGALVNLFRPIFTTLATHKINEMATRSGGWWHKTSR